MLLISYHAVFDVSEEVSKVDVEEISRRSHHDVVIVTVTNALRTMTRKSLNNA